MHVLSQNLMIVINMQHTFKQQYVHDYPSRFYKITLQDYTHRKPHQLNISFAHNWGSYLCAYTQLYKFNTSSPNRHPCVTILQRTMHNASLCDFKKKALFDQFFSDLYFNVVILVQDCVLPQFVCILPTMHGTVLMLWWCWAHLSCLVCCAMSFSFCYRAAIGLLC